MFYQHDKKHGYYERGRELKANPLEGQSLKEVVDNGFKELRTEFKKWRAEGGLYPQYHNEPVDGRLTHVHDVVEMN